MLNCLLCCRLSGTARRKQLLDVHGTGYRCGSCGKALLAGQQPAAARPPKGLRAAGQRTLDCKLLLYKLLHGLLLLLLPTDNAVPVVIGLQPPSAWPALRNPFPCDGLHIMRAAPAGSRLDGERFLVAVNLHNNEGVLPHQILQLIQVTILKLTHFG